MLLLVGSCRRIMVLVYFMVIVLRGVTVTAFCSTCRSSSSFSATTPLTMTTAMWTSPTSKSNLLEEDTIATPTMEVTSQILRLPGPRGTRIRVWYPATSSTSSVASSASAAATHHNNVTTTMTLPLLIYSHGIRGNMDTMTDLLALVASHQIVVAAVEHTDGTAAPSTVRLLQDGTESELKYCPYLMTERQQLAHRAHELLHVVEYLPTYISDGLLINCNWNIGPIVLGGIGYGATSAIMAANGAPKRNTTNNIVTISEDDDSATGDNEDTATTITASSSSISTSIIAGLLLHDPLLGLGYGMLPPNKAYNRVPTITYISDRFHQQQQVYGTKTLHVPGCRNSQGFMTPNRFMLPKRHRTANIRQEHLAKSMAAFLHQPHQNLTNLSSAITQDSVFSVVR